MTDISYRTHKLEEEDVRKRQSLEFILTEADTLMNTAPFCIYPHWKRQQIRRRRWETYTFKIAVLALMKSGKSTLINSWLGDEYLPMSSLPETAHVISIQQQSQLRNGLLKKHGKTYAKGASKINTYLRKLNARLREPGFALREHMLTLHVPSISLVDHRLGKQSLQIFDTPGPNEAGMGQLWHKIASVIRNVDAVVYLLDYTKLKTIEEKHILEELAIMRPDLLKNGCVFFVVNKIDRANRHSHAYEETARYVAALLQQQLPGLTITADQILLVAAEEALLARLILNARASGTVHRDFLQKIFGQREIEGDEISPDLLQRSALKLLHISRIEQLEDAILMRLLARKEHLLFAELLHDLQKSLTLFSADLQEIYERLIVRQTSCKAEIGILKEQLRNAEQSQQNSLITAIKENRRGIMYRSQRIIALLDRLSRVESLLEEILLYYREANQANVIKE